MTGDEQDPGDFVKVVEGVVESRWGDEFAAERNMWREGCEGGGDLAGQLHDRGAEMLLIVALDPGDHLDQVLGLVLRHGIRG